MQTIEENIGPLLAKSGLVIEIKASPQKLRCFEQVFLPACLRVCNEPCLLKTDDGLKIKFCEPATKWDEIISCFRDSLHQLENRYSLDTLGIEFEIRSEQTKEQLGALLQIGGRLNIVPYASRDNYPQEPAITIESGWAFGAGNHPTTKLCLEGLLLLQDQGLLKLKKVLDIGTGTAILAIASVKLGASFAVGIDISDEALGVARKNIKTNNMDGKVMVARDINEVNSLGPFDIVLANLIPSVINSVVTSIGHLCHEDTIFILSGISPHQAKGLTMDLAKIGMDEVIMQKEAEGWSLLIVTKKPPYDNLKR